MSVPLKPDFNAQLSTYIGISETYKHLRRVIYTISWSFLAFLWFKQKATAQPQNEAVPLNSVLQNTCVQALFNKEMLERNVSESH
jgi:hypothetical protein